MMDAAGVFNRSNITCTGPGAEQLTALKNGLENCSMLLPLYCSTDLPTIDEEYKASCENTSSSFASSLATCRAKEEEADICSCFEEMEELTAEQKGCTCK